MHHTATRYELHQVVPDMLTHVVPAPKGSDLPVRYARYDAWDNIDAIIPLE
jgi:hypothetical protein